MSYRDQASVLDLEGVRIACLCGENGHGKSALLDAMTWALWGGARGLQVGTRSLQTEELVHFGQSQMEVSLEFLSGETRYRVARKYARGKRSSSETVLDLQVAMGNGFRSIAENSVSATQRKIEQILHMDYETFINTAFLLQGQADRFTRADPMQRKGILGEILGLTLYDRLAEQGRQQARDYQRRADADQVELERLINDLGSRPKWEAELQQARVALDNILPRMDQVREQLEQTQVHLGVLRGQQGDLARLREEAQRSGTMLADLRRRHGLTTQQWEACKRLIAQRQEIEQGARAYEDAHRALLAMEGAVGPYQRLTRERQDLQGTIDRERSRLEIELRALQRAAEELEARARQVPELSAALEQAARGLEQLEAREAEAQQKREALQRITLGAESLQWENERLELELAELRQQLEEVSVQEEHHYPLFVTVILFLLHLLFRLLRQNAYCPLCTRALRAESRTLQAKELAARFQEGTHRHTQNQRLIQENRAQQQALSQALSLLEPAPGQQRTEIMRRRERFEAQLEQCRSASDELVEVRRQADGLEEQIRSAAYAKAETAQLRGVEGQLAELGYDPLRHQGLRQQVERLRRASDDLHALQEAERQVSGFEEEAKRLEAQRGEEEKRLEQLQDQANRLREELAALPSLESQRRELTLEEATLRRQHMELQAMEVRCRQRLEELEEKGRQRATLEVQLSAWRSEQETQELLAEAFGRNGLQAMLIDEALPELEIEANHLLARLTDNRMSLRLETQRQTKKGTPQETLEILVADELGTRGYELFSGGEAFRINFALRVALAKLLASRAGAPLRTLFIDEGFGTQDAEGRERLVESIHAIQGDFDLILVITHIDELKEAFPVRIEVTKTESAGSTFRVVM
ncbi:MAG: SMC family ATPase [Chloroflexi bacterium]|nr:SMC family ATPase [Chloroflexota bacterium]